MVVPQNRLAEVSRSDDATGNPMTLFLHGLAIGLLFAGALGLLWLALELFLAELRNLR